MHDVIVIDAACPVPIELGEHTMPSPENGTVEGAIASGERAAKQVLQS